MKKLAAGVVALCIAAGSWFGVAAPAAADVPQTVATKACGKKVEDRWLKFRARVLIASLSGARSDNRKMLKSLRGLKSSTMSAPLRKAIDELDEALVSNVTSSTPLLDIDEVMSAYRKVGGIIEVDRC